MKTQNNHPNRSKQGQYVVYANHNHEQSSWLLSRHNTARAAWQAADKWTRNNQCDGGDLLAHVYIVVVGCSTECQGHDDGGQHFHPVDFFDAHAVEPQSGGLGYKLSD